MFERKAFDSHDMSKAFCCPGPTQWRSRFGSHVTPLFGGLLLAAMVVMPRFARAQTSLIVRDSFEYATGSIAGDDGGYGWEGQAWTTSSSSTPDNVTAGSLTFSENGRALVTSGNKLTTVGSNVGAYRNPPTDFGAYGGDNNQDLWIGFLASNTTSNLSSSYAGLSLLQNGTEEFFIGAPNGANTYGFQNDSVVGFANDPQLDANNTAVNATTHFIVTHLSFSASGSTEATLYIDPTPGVTTMDEFGDVVPDVAPAADYTYETSFQFSQMRFSTLR